MGFAGVEPSHAALRSSPYPTTMIRLFLSAMIPAAVAALPGLSRRTPILIDSAENCRFNLGPRQYDLCPILNGTAAQSLLVKGEGKGAYLFHFGLEDTDSGSSRDAGSHVSISRVSVFVHPFNTLCCLCSVHPEPGYA